MITPRIKAGNQWLTVSDLKENRLPDLLNEYEIKAIQFCQSWLSDKQDFEFNTSGSTGSPKKIYFKRSQLISSARSTAQALDLQAGYTALICLDTDFIAGAMMVVRSFVTGMNMIIKAPSANPLKGITEPVDFLAIVPYQLNTLLEQAPSKLNEIRTVIIGGAPLNNETIKSLQSLSPAFYATYGMTETITQIALQKLNGPDHQDYFQLLPGVEASVDSRGCLVINSAYLEIGTLITNDIISLISKDKFRWIGRYDRVINSGGLKISPEKIERLVEIIFDELRIERRFFIAGISDAKFGEQVALLIEGAALEHVEEENIKIQLGQRLDKYEVPKTVLYALNFIETATQKIDRLNTLKLIQK